MKRILTMIIALAMLGSMTFAGIAEQADTMEEEQAFEIIQNGSTGEAVRMLQTKLKGLGYQIGLVDGIFGPRTESGLRELQSAMGADETGVVSSQEELDHILNAVKGDGINMVWDGCFQNRDKYWSNWGEPTICEIVEINDQNWMHLVSSGEQWEGLRQDISLRSGDNSIIELHAEQTYTLSFKAFASEKSIGKSFTCGIHNVIPNGTDIQEQYWMKKDEIKLTSIPTLYRYTFIPKANGSFRVMVGQGLEDKIDAYFTEIKLETGELISEWSESPEL